MYQAMDLEVVFEDFNSYVLRSTFLATISQKFYSCFIDQMENRGFLAGVVTIKRHHLRGSSSSLQAVWVIS